MTQYVSAFIAMLAVAASGAVHGLWTDRWGQQDEPAASAARLGRAVLGVPGWTCEEREPVSKEDWIAGQLHCRFTSQRTGQAVTLFMVCGKPGPISIHTPDVCYGAGGFAMSGRSHFQLDSAAEFQTALFRKTSESEQTTLRIFWAWSHGAGWSAPDDPRFQFASQPALFKLYLIRETSPGEEVEPAHDACAELMRLLLPRLEETLFSGNESACSPATKI